MSPWYPKTRVEWRVVWGIVLIINVLAVIGALQGDLGPLLLMFGIDAVLLIMNLLIRWEERWLNAPRQRTKKRKRS